MIAAVNITSVRLLRVNLQRCAGATSNPDLWMPHGTIKINAYAPLVGESLKMSK